MNNITLPTKSEIGKITVKELNKEFEDIYQDQRYILDGTSKILQTVLYTCDNIFNSKAHFTDKRFVEFQSRDRSYYYFDARSIPEGVIAMVSAVYLGGLIPSKNSDTTTFLYAEILDRFEQDSTLIGENGYGGLLNKCIKEILMKHYSTSGEIEVSKRLLERFKEQLNEHPFVYEPNLGTYRLENTSYCDTNEENLSMAQVVNHLPLWYGTKAVIKTKNIRKLLIDIFCIEEETVKFPELWNLIRKKIGAWLVNSPVEISSYVGEVDEDAYSFTTPDSLKFTDDPLDNSIWALELEKEVKLIVSKFNKEELILIEDKLSGVPATTSAKKLGLGERTLQRKQKELFEKFSKLLVKLQIDYGDEFSQGDILDTFRTEVIYSVKV